MKALGPGTYGFVVDVWLCWCWLSRRCGGLQIIGWWCYSSRCKRWPLVDSLGQFSVLCIEFWFETLKFYGVLKSKGKLKKIKQTPLEFIYNLKKNSMGKIYENLLFFFFFPSQYVSFFFLKKKIRKSFLNFKYYSKNTKIVSGHF